MLNRPLRKIERAPLVPQPFDLLPEALIFAEDALCVPRQLAALLNLCEGKVADEFDSIAGDWRDVGITANQVLAYAQIHGLRCIVFFQSKRIAEYKPDAASHKRTICMSIEGGHAFFYSCCKRMLEKVGHVLPSRLAKICKYKPVASKPFEGLAEGVFWSSDLTSLRMELLRQGHHVKATLSAPFDLKSLQVPIARGKVCMITNFPENAEELKAWLAEVQYLAQIPLVYRGETMPSLTQRVLVQILHEKRYRLSTAEKKALLSEQEYRCKECSSVLDKPEYDHVVPLCQSVGEQRFQVLCSACHEAKTWSQTTPVENCMASCFNVEVWKQYVELSLIHI